jgi:hypothetical protein
LEAEAIKMTRTVSHSSLYTAAVRRAVPTNADYESPITRDYGREDTAHASWDLIDKKLIEWGCDPSQLDEEGTITPSGDTIQLAIQVATELDRQGCAAPTRVVPDPHGGIVFELQGNSVFESIHVKPDWGIEYRVLKNHRVVLREALQPQPTGRGLSC